MHAAHGHALVLGFNDHRNTFGLQLPIDGVGDLHREFFLDLQATGVDLHHPGEFGEPHHPPIGQISHMGLAQKGNHVMLAVTHQRDVAHHHHLVVALDLGESGFEHLGRVLLVASKELSIGPGHAGRSALQPLPVRIITSPQDQGTHGLFGGFSTGLLDHFLA